jgi:hypothetical protein
VISTKTAAQVALAPSTKRHSSALSGVDDGEGAPYKAGKWRRAEILPPMFFQEQFED